jgi:ABC-type sugar transport system ATPase subunit
MADVILRSLSKKFGNSTIIDNLDLSSGMVSL